MQFVACKDMPHLSESRSITTESCIVRPHKAFGAIQRESVLSFAFCQRQPHYKEESVATSVSTAQAVTMPPKRALEIRPGDLNSRKWHMSLTEDAFISFLSHGGDAAKAVFGEGSLFSPFLFGKFFDPADAFPLWDFDSDALLSGLRNAKKTSVNWAETDSEYALRAELPGGKKCEVEINGDKVKVIEISGQWRALPASGQRDWRAGRWWEHGFVRRLELPDDANWKKAEAYFYDDGFLEIKMPKNISAECSTHHLLESDTE